MSVTFGEQGTPRPDVIPYQPNLRDQAAGLLGRLASGHQGLCYYRIPEEYLVEGYGLNELLDYYGDKADEPVLMPWEGDADDSALPLLALLTAGPQIEKPLFVPALAEAETQPVCRIRGSFSEWVRLPRSNFVYAPNMENWNGGRAGSKFEHDTGVKRSSRNTIRSYARRATPIPPITWVSANVQPNGVVLYRVHRDGAHRVAAAHLRRDSEITVNGIIVVNRLSKDLVAHPGVNPSH